MVYILLMGENNNIRCSNWSTDDLFGAFAIDRGKGEVTISCTGFALTKVFVVY